MLPPFLLTFIVPSSTVHLAGSWVPTATHWSALFPSKSTTASEGGRAVGCSVAGAGVTTGGSGFQTSVSSGRGRPDFSCATRFEAKTAARSDAEARANAVVRLVRILGLA